MLRMSARFDRLENFLLLLAHCPAALLKDGLAVAYSNLSQRIIRHFYGAGQTPVPRESLQQPYMMGSIFSNSLTAAEVFQLLSETGFLDAVKGALPIKPDVAYLQLRAKLTGWDPSKVLSLLHPFFPPVWISEPRVRLGVRRFAVLGHSTEGFREREDPEVLGVLK